MHSRSGFHLVWLNLLAIAVFHGILPRVTFADPIFLGRRGVTRTVNFAPGPNLVSLPLAVTTTDGRPLAASDLARALSAGFIARFEPGPAGRLRAVPYMSASTASPDFTFEAATAYLASVPAATTITFRGVSWGFASVTQPLQRGLRPLSLPHGVPAGLTARALVAQLGLGVAIASTPDGPGGRARFHVVVPGAIGATFGDLLLHDGAGLLVSSPRSGPVSLPFANSAPVAATGGDRTVTSNIPFTLTGDASTDPDGDTVTYRWTQIDGATTASPGNSAFESLSAPSVGRYIFRLHVSDGQAESSPADVHVDVSAPATAGLAQVIQTVPASTGGSLVVSSARVEIEPGLLLRDAGISVSQSAGATLATTLPGAGFAPPLEISVPAGSLSTGIDGRTTAAIRVTFEIPADVDPQTVVALVEEQIQGVSGPVTVQRFMPLSLPTGSGLPAKSGSGRRAVVALFLNSSLFNLFGTGRVRIEPRTYEATADWKTAPTLRLIGQASSSKTRVLVLVHGLQFLISLSGVLPGRGIVDFAQTQQEYEAQRSPIWNALRGVVDPARPEFAANLADLAKSYEIYEYWYPTARPIEWSASELERLIRAQAGARPVTLVAHSMGGLVSRRAAAPLGTQLASVLTLSSPLRGSLLSQMVESKQTDPEVSGAVEAKRRGKLGRTIRNLGLSLGTTLLSPGLRDLGWDGTIPVTNDPFKTLTNRINTSLATFNASPEAKATEGRLYAVFGGTSGPPLPDLGEDEARLLVTDFFPDLPDGDALVQRTSALAQNLFHDPTPGGYFGATSASTIDQTARFNLVTHVGIHEDPRVLALVHNFLSAEASSGANHPPVARAGAPQDVTVSVAPSSSAPSQVQLDASESLDPDGNSPLSYFWTMDAAEPADGATLDPVTPSRAIGARPRLSIVKPGTYHLKLAVTDGHGAIAHDETSVTLRSAAGVALTVSPAAGGSAELRWTRSTKSDPRGYRIVRDTQPLIANPSLSLAPSRVVLDIPDATQTSSTVLGLAPGVEYYFRIFENYQDLALFRQTPGNLTWTRTAPEGTSVPAAPSGLTVTFAASGTGTAKWTATSEASRFATYQVVSSPTSGVTLETGTLRFAGASSSVVQATLAALPAGQRLYFRLFLVDVDGNISAGSNEVAVDVPTGGTVGDLVFLRTNTQGFKEYRNPKDNSELIEVPAGSFTMGQVGIATPVHTVSLSRYFIGKYEVTNAQYRAFLAATGDPKGPTQHQGHHPDEGANKNHTPYYALDSSDYKTYSNGESNPVILIDWYDCYAYCAWAGLAMPTEAQWERAARGTDGRTYPWGNDAPNAGGVYRANYDPGNYTEDGFRYTSPVGSFGTGAPSPRADGTSPVGALDMAGNVWEWVFDWYDGSYYGSQTTWNDPTGPVGPLSARVIRGGSWDGNDNYLRAAGRYSADYPTLRGNLIGFRVARVAR